MSSTKTTRHLVIGGGIAGLSAAWTLTKLRPNDDVVVLESSGRLGGKIRTTDFAGLRVDTAADAFLARVPWATDLSTEIGLRDQLVSPDRSDAYIWTRTGLRRFPQDTILGVPSNPWSLHSSGVVSRSGAFRAALEPLLPRFVGRRSADPSLLELVGSRFGSAVANDVVDPLVGGINGGNVADLSTASAAPQIQTLSNRHRSLRQAVRISLAQRSNDETAPTFFAPPDGMETMVIALARLLEQQGVQVRTGTAVLSIGRHDEGYRVTLNDTSSLDADTVVIAIPAHQASRLLHNLDTTLGNEVEGIRHTSVTMIRLAYTTSSIDNPLDGSGFVVPSHFRRLITAGSFASSKWKRLHNGKHVILRISVGRQRDTRHQDMSDDELVRAVRSELEPLLDIRSAPDAVDIQRWPDSFPQYEVGYAARMERITERVNQLRGLALAGAAYGGVGIPTCIRSGSVAAQQVVGS